MELKSIVPWGRSFNEYLAMLSLTREDLGKKILGCGDGPASFNAELSRMGGDVTSVDPIYQFSADQIRSRVDEACSLIIGQVKKHMDDFVWKNIPDVDALTKTRMDAMNLFLEDYAAFRDCGRYLNAALPHLPFGNGAFDLALCSHYLFLYSDHLTCEQHIMSMRELCRVAEEVRVYPLISINGNQISPHLDAVMEDLRSAGNQVSMLEVDYEFQKGATKMLVVKRS